MMGINMRFPGSRVFFAFVVAVFLTGGLSGCETGEEAVNRLIGSAEKGDVEAMLKIATLYCGGMSIEQDDQVCAVWMKRAAEGGHKKAQYMMGEMYKQGLGVRTDLVQSYRWFTLSAELGYQMSGTAVKKLEAVMTPSQLTQARRLIEESKAAHKATGRYFVADRK